MIKFKKMHGLGNDFVVIDTRSQPVNVTEDFIRTICDRRFGVGCDQLVIISVAQSDADVYVTFYNADGSESGACGNATRCVADIVLLETCREDCKIETRAGILRAWATRGGMISVDMGEPRLDYDQIPLSQDCDTLHLPLDGDPIAVNMGNPHCVFFIDQDLNDDELKARGTLIENDPLFPERTNVEFVTVVDDNRLRQRTWERGSGMTLACGSGACAVAVAAMRRGIVHRDQPVQIDLDGGSLLIEWGQRDNRVTMIGPVSYVFDGVWTA